MSAISLHPAFGICAFMRMISRFTQVGFACPRRERPGDFCLRKIRLVFLRWRIRNMQMKKKGMINAIRSMGRNVKNIRVRSCLRLVILNNSSLRHLALDAGSKRMSWILFFWTLRPSRRVTMEELFGMTAVSADSQCFRDKFLGWKPLQFDPQGGAAQFFCLRIWTRATPLHLAGSPA